ncbi:hypothetical protein HUU62_17885 [Rhodoferax sp. 4810]|uniref:Uncharacterized protein n=1 Tax=Thiospirillum jenense TaxID=1653858 RepID=A0A839HEL3_9GAMM|nr:hypothetical protein [Thiospirillum jenense]MBB1076279.1 hypothetical protein [Rhodoferax jenense]MBB1124872.1 hypothetical protein [Thiospirillum jenense]
MPADSISIAFDMILDEIDSVIGDVNTQGAAFLRQNEYAQAKTAIAAGENLGAFRNKLAALKHEWITELDEATRQRVQLKNAVESAGESIDEDDGDDADQHDNADELPDEWPLMTQLTPFNHKSPKTILVVKFADGAVIYEKKASDTFAQVIKKLGWQRVAALNFAFGKAPLISKQKLDTVNQVNIGQCFVTTHSSTDAKRRLLLKIAQALNENFSVDIVKP